MAGFKVSAFKGRYPGVERRLLPENAATIARDLKLGFGDIKPLHGYTSLGVALEDRGMPKSLFKYQDTWLHFGVPASFVTAPSGQDQWERVVFSLDEQDDADPAAVYVSGDVPPDAATNEATTGTGPFPDSWKALGVPIPAAAPVVITFTAGGDVEDQRLMYYCHTLVNDRGEEGAPSVPSEGVTINEKTYFVQLDCEVDEVTQSSNDVDDTDYRTITHVRLYRLFALDSTQTWMFVKEVPAAEANVIEDSIATSALDGDTLVTFGWNPPPLGLKGLRVLPNGAVVGFKKDELIFSEPWYPYAYPVRYRYKVDKDIVGIGIFGSSIAVLTTAQPYIAMGVHPGEMTLTKMEADQSCVSMRSIVDFGDRVVWASPDGLFAVGTNGVEAITATFMDKRVWRADFDTTTIHAYAYEGVYIAFYGNGTGGFMINPYAPEEGLVDLSAYATAAFRDMETDTLYLSMAEDTGYGVFSFDTDSAHPLTWEWRSKVVEFPAHISLGRAQLIGTGYATASFQIDTLYLDDTGALVPRDTARSVTSRNPIPLRSGTLMTDWLVGMRGSGECEAILVGETIKDIRGQ